LSPILYALTAAPPQAPPAATVIKISAISVTLQLHPTHDNGGSTVLNYLLYRNDGASTTLTAISSATYSYTTNGFLAVITLADESMSPGGYYQFSYKAVNKVGESEASNIVTVPIADYPAKPTGLFRSASSKTSISVLWNESMDT
jgi:hypothetical protein